MISTKKEFENFVQLNGDKMYSKERNISIQFGDPVDGKASIHVLCNDSLMEVLSLFTWEQTLALRKIFAFGDNHRCNPQTWIVFVSCIRNTLISEYLKERRKQL